MTTAPEVAPLPEPDVPAVGELELAAGFPPADREQWQRLVRGVLVKGRRLAEDASPAQAEAALATTLPDGFSVAGIYTAADAYPATGVPGAAPYTRGRLATRTGWDVRCLHEDPDPVVTNQAVLDDLEGGASSIWLRLGGEGLAVSALPQVLDGVFLDLAPVVLDAGAESAAAAAALFELAAANGVSDEALLATLGVDPIGLAARTGDAPDFTDAIGLATTCADRYPGVRAIVVDALPCAEAGATDGQELGAALASGVACLRALTAAGMGVEAACGQLEFRYVATADQFVTIAKLRAARQLWSRVCEVSGVAADHRGQRQHAVTSWSMLSRFDSHTNLLRSTIAAFGAGIGGADAVTVLPFDAALGLPDTFSRRIARNTSSLLMEESHVAAVTDPAGGSWAVEALTESLAQAGWQEFQTIEAAGGIAAALADGSLAERLAASAEAGRQRLSSGTSAIIGVSEFPDLTEPAAARPAAPRRPDGGLPRIRVAEPLEVLRLRAQAAATTRPQQAVLLEVGSGKATAAAVAAVEKALRPGGITTVRSTVDTLATSTDTWVAILCHPADADPGDIGAARSAAAAAGADLVLDGAAATDLLALIGQVLAVTAPPQAPDEEVSS